MFFTRTRHPLPSRRPAYDPDRHITARELKGLGFYLHDNLPDEAFVRRAAVGLDPAEDLDDGTATLGLSVLEPFVVPADCVLA